MLSGRLSLRAARPADGEKLQALQGLALRHLATSHYTASQIENGLAAIGTLDRTLIGDSTYYVAELDGRLVGCGGWSFRARIAGNDETMPELGQPLEPHCDAARIRAVFVHPAWARRGITRRLVLTAEAAARQAGFRRFALVSTLNAEPFYRSLGYRPVEQLHLDLPEARLPVIRMTKECEPPALADRAA
ncbi:MAG TPA: GNAT family N-acetyltransferase [Geminicoccaceae bacterium]|nr:GNAT family N-acetyltransferase [Geminicoccaceae bacterium]